MTKSAEEQEMNGDMMVPDTAMSKKKEAGGRFNRVMVKLHVVNPEATPVNWEYIGLAFIALVSTIYILSNPYA